MHSWGRYKVYCETEEAWISAISDASLTQCPNDSGHTVRGGSCSLSHRGQAVALSTMLTAVEAGVSEVVANGRPATEIASGITGFGAKSFRWIRESSQERILVCVQFILKETGTGTKTRIAVKLKAQATGEDSSEAFSPSSFSVTTVNYTTLGEVFEAHIEMDASGINVGDAVTIHVGRDGNNGMGAGDNDDVDVAIQIISFEVEVV